MPNSVNVRRELRMVLLEQVGIERQSRIAATHFFGTRNNQGLARNVRRSRAARCLKIEKFSRVGQGINSPCSVNLNLSQELTHSSRIPLLLQRQFINSQLSGSICFFATDSS